MSAVLDTLFAQAAASCDAAAPDAELGARFAHDALTGLARTQKSIPSMWLYDARGSALFEQITALPEYYPTRNETWILERCASQIGELAGRGAVVVELGSGSSRKTPLLLDALDAPAAYVPIDVSASSLAASTGALRRRYPALAIEPMHADFTHLPALHALPASGRRVVFFPGATIGNFSPAQAIALLDRVGRVVGPDALLVVGVDSTRDPAVLVPAYDDAAGVTAAFDLNLLLRMNRELGADFNPTAFRHEARWNAAEQRVEMHLVSLYTQRITMLGRSVRFALGESLHTENAYKYGVMRFQAMAHRAGWCHRQLWVDGQARFAVHVLERSRSATPA